MPISKLSESKANGKFDVVYITTQGKPYPLEVGFAVVPSTNVPVDDLTTSEACRKGCRLYGRNGGCPPFAPGFNQIPGDELIVLHAKLMTEHFPERVLKGPYYSRWVFVETFLTPLTNRIGKALASSLKGYFLSSGNCHGCRPKRCAVKDNLPCRAPDKKTFSLEATGVLVTELMKGVFGIELQWWQQQDPAYVPDYMNKVVGIKGESFSVRRLPNLISGTMLQNRVHIISAKT